MYSAHQSQSKALIVKPDISKVVASDVKQLIDNLIPVNVCQRYRLVPIALDQTQPPSLLVAMVEPNNLNAHNDLNLILRRQGTEWHAVEITDCEYHHLINKCLNNHTERNKHSIQKQLEGEHRQQLNHQKYLDTTFDLECLKDVVVEESINESSNLEEESNPSSAPVVNLINKILVKALNEGASDVHVEPLETNLRIRFRRDGILYQAIPALPKSLIPSVTSRFKILANLDISERRIPQDGRICWMFQGRKINFRVSTLPSRYGEKIVLRVLDNLAIDLELNKLVNSSESLGLIKAMASRPFGLILITGPTGSGKSTTLYATLAEVNALEVNVCTVEDPIEYSLPGITQVQVVREKGMNFAEVLRSFLRQDPDVIIVGETRDSETAKTATEAALTGHLVLTTMHTNDAASAVIRLKEMGVENFMIGSCLIGVVAQRLVRLVCQSCCTPYVPSDEQLARFDILGSEYKDLVFYRASHSLNNSNSSCLECNGVGYKGRCGVFEVMQISSRLQSLMTTGASTEQIKSAAVEEGMQTLLAYGFELVCKGYTTLEEVERVLL